MNALCVLARAPVPGAGKSRLRAELGDDAVDGLAAAFIGDVLGWRTPFADLLLVAHEGPADRLPAGCGRHAAVAQPAGDLGARIAHAVDAAFERGATRAVVVGTDCPTLPPALLRACFDCLDRQRSTLVPADDGGWIALGVDRPLGAALAGVRWSRATTAAETVAALTADGRAPLLLPSWYDVDEPADLERLRADPVLRERAPLTAAALLGVGVPGR